MALQTPRLEKEGLRCSRCKSRVSPAAHGEDHGEAGCSHAVHGGLHAPGGGYALEKATAHGKPMQEHGFLAGIHTCG